MKKKEEIEKLKEELEQCCAEFRAKIEELEKPEFINPMSRKKKGDTYFFTDHYSRALMALEEGDGFDDSAFSSGNYFHNEKLAERESDIVKLRRLMLRDALEDWGGEEIIWGNIHTKYKYSVDHIGSGCNTSIYIIGYTGSKTYTTPIFKTRQALVDSIKRHRDLFDKVFNCKGYDIV